MKTKTNNIVIDFGLPRTASRTRQFYFLDHSDLTTIRHFHMSALEKIATSEKPVLISDEGFYYNRSYKGKPTYVVDALKTLFPTAKAFVVTRERNSWLRSLYNQYVRGRSFGQMHYDEWYETIGSKMMEQEDFVEYLNKIFEEVLVMDFKEFIASKQDFLTRICEYIGITYVPVDIGRSNKSLTKQALQFRRWANTQPLPIREPIRYFLESVRRCDE